MPWEKVHDPEEAAALEPEQTDYAREAAYKRQQEAMILSQLETPEKDAVPAEPAGPRESWPIAHMPDGEDVCGDGGVLKSITAPGIDAIGKPPVGASCRLEYRAYTMDGREWDAKDVLHLRLGMLYVSRGLEAAAASMAWGESATFVFSRTYAEGNNATRRPLPDGECFRFEARLLGWKSAQLRGSGVARCDMSGEQRIDEAARLKTEAAPLVGAGEHGAARELYREAAWYVMVVGRDGEELVPPEGRHAEAQALLLSLYLNAAMCSCKLGEWREAEEAAGLAIEHKPASAELVVPDAQRVRAHYWRGVARRELHEFAEALSDLHDAARIDPKSRDVRDAIARTKERRELANESDAKFFNKSLGKPKRAPPAVGAAAASPPPPVWLDIAVGGEPFGRLVFELFECAPLTAENFRCLCTGERGIGRSGVALHYKGCNLHRLVAGWLLQGGDIVHGNGRGGDSIYGGFFRDESFERRHDARGLLSMANGGPDTNSSQFFITLAADASLDGKSVVFGRVAPASMPTLDALEELEVDAADAPLRKIEVSDCGELPRGSALEPVEVAPAE